MQAAEDEVDAEVGEDDGVKAEDRAHGVECAEVFYAESAADIFEVDQDRIDDPGYKGPRLLGVPAPVGAPSLVGPYRTSYYADKQKQESKPDGLIVE